MKKKVLIFWLFLIVLIVSSFEIANAMQCPAGAHTFSGGTEASDASLCIPDVGASGPVTTGTQTTQTTATQQNGVNYQTTHDQSTTETEPSQPTLPSPNKISDLDAYLKGVRADADTLYTQWLKLTDNANSCDDTTWSNRKACDARAGTDAHAQSNCADVWIAGSTKCADNYVREYDVFNEAKTKLEDQLDADLIEYYDGLTQKQLDAISQQIYDESTACRDRDTADYNACPQVVDLNMRDSLDCTGKIMYSDRCLIPRIQSDAISQAYSKFPQEENQQQGTEQTGNNNQNTNSNPGSASASTPTFNTNDNRGRGSKDQRINPSIGGYLGDAYVTRADGTKVIPGKELYLKVDDVVVTGVHSNANIIFSNAGSINLGPNTVVRVGNALLDQYYLARGSLKSQIDWGTLPPQKLQFHTPNAVVSVKGTEFIISYNETTNITVVYLNRGVLEVNTSKNITNLTAGNYLAIYPNGATWTSQLKPENWDYLKTNYYETPAINTTIKAYNQILIIMFFIDLIAIVLLTLWMGKKMKNPDKKDKSTSMGTWSLVLGILGIILSVAPYVGIIISALAFSLSRVQNADKPTGLATAGFVLSIIGFILNIIFWIAVITNMFSGR